MKTSKFQDQAKAAAERIDQARQTHEQLTFLPDADGHGGAMVAADDAPKVGRPKGSKNRTENQLRAMFAARGHRMPEDVLAEIAGLTSRDDVFITAMARAEQVLAWAQSGAAKVGKHQKAWEPSGGHRMSVFVEIYKAQIKALDSLLPYGLAKVTPDVNQNTNITQIVMPGAPAGPAPTVIEGQINHNLAPPPMPQETQQNQEVTNSQGQQSDAESRTE